MILINGNGVLPVTTAFKTLEAGVAQIVDGQPAKPAQGLTLRQRFLVQDLLLAVLLALVLWPLLRLQHWTRRLRRDRAAGHPRWIRAAARITAEIVLPLVLLVAVRLALGALGAQSWSEGLALFPDTGASLWAIALIVLFTGALRLTMAIRIRRASPRSTVLQQ